MDMNLGKFWEMVRDREPVMLQSMGSQRVRYDWVTEQHTVYIVYSIDGTIYLDFCGSHIIIVCMHMCLVALVMSDSLPPYGL